MPRFTVLSTCAADWGGSEELWWEAACALRRAGYDVDVLKVNVAGAHPRIAELRRLGCRVHDLNALVPRRLASALGAVLPGPYGLDTRRRQAVAALAHLAARRPDLAIIAQGGNLDGAHVALVCARLRVPFVTVAQKASESGWPTDKLRPHLTRMLEDARRSLFVSEHNLTLTERQVGRPIARAEVVRNPTLVARGAGPRPWPAAPDDVLRLACVARLDVGEKGQDLLLDVLAQPDWRARPVHVSFFGSGPNRAGLEGLAARRGLVHVSFEGQTAGIEEVWRTHHALVLPSRGEGLPLALVEAMACGRIGVVTDVGGSAEVIADGRTGFVAAEPTVASFGDAMERAWAARAEWQAMGGAAARRIDELVPVRDVPRLAEIALEAATA